ncbi:MAG TPA: GNAT family N-acetyltransferase [Gemmatimonadaceae bacterium]|jgi:GNAT superfamily N-acetyltransferase|nr:GNAT family N-acetyltransferase [Gemmatimonadaceae bacterium]
MSTSVRSISPTELDQLLPDLTELFRETVNGGVPMGFFPPLTHDQGRNYWLVVRAELEAGTRLLIAAFTENRLVGSGQLALATRPNGSHRAEVEKLFVTTALRGKGVGRLLMAALHEAAIERGRYLVLLNTRHGSRAERFYKELGYREVGPIPGWSLGPAGERYDHVILYQDLS